MATFGDMMSLLLTFFVLLLSFSSMDAKRFFDVAGSMRNAFGIQRLTPGQFEALTESLISLSKDDGSPYLRVLDMRTRFPEKRRKLLRRIRMQIHGKKLERIIEVENSPRGVIVRVPGSLLFRSGSARLRPESLVFLREIAGLIGSTPGEVSIEGHSDTTPGRTASTNWRLSAERAVAALEYLVEVGGVDPKRLRATGFADTRPLVRSASPEAQQANRRVEFVFLPDVEETTAPSKPVASRGSAAGPDLPRTVSP